MKTNEEIVEFDNSKYNKCLNQLNDIIHFGIALTKLAIDGKWNRVAPKVPLLLQYISLTIKCFVDAQNFQTSTKIDPICVINHLVEAGKLAYQIINDIISRKWNKIQQHLIQLKEVLEDIKN